ncbi:hypothetical protein AAFC00_002171 [Neodothiora populina]|uniref:Uncharacterized protein n=1 Tax=Neodothiora populina TaxID=2781224 RepID=A0ABR3PGL6_9PEZI
MVYKAGAGPEAVPFKELTAKKLAQNITKALQPEVQERAHELAAKIKGEDGPRKAAKIFHETPQMRNIACFLCPDHVAVWRVRRTNIQLSSLAVAVLITRGKLNPRQLKLARHNRWYVEEGSQDPITGMIGAFTSTATGLMNDVDDYAHDISRHKGRSRKASIRSSMQNELDERHRRSASTSSRWASMEESRDGLATPSRQSEQTHRRKISKGEHFVTASGEFIDSSLTHVAKLPVAMLYNLANGFHNAPARLGDKTVRLRDPITGVLSGMKVGGKELVFGTYDAFSGILTQPYFGLQEGIHGQHGGAAAGMAKGVGLGFVGLVFKLPAAIIGPLGYSCKGIERSMQKWWSGTDQLTGDEVAAILKAKDEIKQVGLSDDASEHSAQVFWNEAKGAGVGKRMVERRVWQGYREVRELRNIAEGAKIEETIMQRWTKLEVDENFLAELMT